MDRQEGTYRIKEDSERMYSQVASTYNYQVLDVKGGMAFISPTTTVKTNKDVSLRALAHHGQWVDVASIYRVDAEGAAANYWYLAQDAARQEQWQEVQQALRALR